MAIKSEERLRKLMQHGREGLSGEELQARVDEITKGADEFVKKLHLFRLSDQAGKASKVGSEPSCLEASAGGGPAARSRTSRVLGGAQVSLGVTRFLERLGGVGHALQKSTLGRPRVPEGHRHGRAAIAPLDMEVKVGLGAGPRIAAHPDPLPLCHLVPDLHERAVAGQVYVAGDRAIGVQNVDVVLLARDPGPVGEALLDKENPSAPGGEDRSADGHERVVGVLHDGACGV